MELGTRQENVFQGIVQYNAVFLGQKMLWIKKRACLKHDIRKWFQKFSRTPILATNYMLLNIYEVLLAAWFLKIDFVNKMKVCLCQTCLDQNLAFLTPNIWTYFNLTLHWKCLQYLSCDKVCLFDKVINLDKVRVSHKFLCRQYYWRKTEENQTIISEFKGPTCSL